ncbi:MAG: hypothetical protein OHK93_008428 [Ramalina farinacea]|uniref:WW domain-containing protein n=1 Tax=Ramalina farinacea TaxID=258253 RepID=A0AA43TWI4_9LECA|nr:hypothetical protein [Ramalina farinacea]
MSRAATPSQQEGPDNSPPKLPQGYVAQWDGSSRKFYYVETATGVSTWTVPSKASASVPVVAPTPQPEGSPYDMPPAYEKGDPESQVGEADRVSRTVEEAGNNNNFGYTPTSHSSSGGGYTGEAPPTSYQPSNPSGSYNPSPNPQSQQYSGGNQHQSSTYPSTSYSQSPQPGQPPSTDHSNSNYNQASHYNSSGATMHGALQQDANNPPPYHQQQAQQGQYPPPPPQPDTHNSKVATNPIPPLHHMAANSSLPSRAIHPNKHRTDKCKGANTLRVHHHHNLMARNQHHTEEEEDIRNSSSNSSMADRPVVAATKPTEGNSSREAGHRVDSPAKAGTARRITALCRRSQDGDDAADDDVERFELARRVPCSHQRDVAAKGYECDESFASLFELQRAVAAIVLFQAGGKSRGERLQHSAFAIDDGMDVMCVISCLLNHTRVRLYTHDYVCIVDDGNNKRAYREL